ncbi:MAG: ATP-binding cassette domain-containing protein [Candidatus Helarchaeota archaeon]
MAIVFKELTKNYGKIQAVRRLKGTVNKGIVGFLGPNGAGKTTTFKMIMGLIHPSSGSAEIFGHDIIKESILSRKNVGFLPERSFLFLDKTCWDFLKYSGKLAGIAGLDLNLCIKDALDSVGIVKKWWKKRLKVFSAGMRQRVGLAATIINPHNRLIILDEPTANLDPIGRQEVLDKIKALNKSKDLNVFMSSHILSEIEQVCSEILIIHEGEIVLSGKISELSKYFCKDQLKIKISNNELFLKELEKELNFTVEENDDFLLIKTENVSLLRQISSKIVNRCGLEILHMEEVSLNLNELFKKIVKK